MDHQAFAQLLGNYGEFLGAIAVVVTLGYLAAQIRQNTRSIDETRRLAMAQTYQARAFQIDRILNDRAIGNSELVSARLKLEQNRTDELTKEEHLRLAQSMSADIMRIDNLQYQLDQGYLDPESAHALQSTIRRWAPQWAAMGLEPQRPRFKAEVARILREDPLPEYNPTKSLPDT